MTLSHSRMWAVVWSVRQDLLSWLDCHNRALVWLGGVPASVRIDNLKTGVAEGAGAWAVLNPGYASYAKQLGFIIDPCRVRTPQDKGKVERRGHDVKYVVVREGERFATIAGLQSVTERRVLEQAHRLLCPVTGTPIHTAWQAERATLAPLPMTLPQPFDVQVHRKVGRDCLVAFEGRQYSVPYDCAGGTVELRGCARTVEIYRSGACIARFPRHTECRLLIDRAHYDGPSTARVTAPAPLGRMARRGVLAAQLGAAGRHRAKLRTGAVPARRGCIVMSRSRGISGLDRVRALLQRLGWIFTVERLPELIEQGVREELALAAFVEFLVESEASSREERRVTRGLKQSHLPIGRTLDSFDFLFNRSIEREKIEMLATCEFVRRKETILLLGPPGTGKTHLAAALGMKAVQNGFSVRFLEADELIESMRKVKDGNAYADRPRYLTANVLIIDELGFQALDRRDAHRLFQVVNQRYERASTIITSNKSITEWPTMLAGDEALASAILDRLLHHCHVIQTDGASYRLRHIEQQLKLQPNLSRGTAAEMP